MNIDRWQSVPSQQLENSVIITNKSVDMWFGSIISDSHAVTVLLLNGISTTAI